MHPPLGRCKDDKIGERVGEDGCEIRNKEAGILYNGNNNNNNNTQAANTQRMRMHRPCVPACAGGNAGTMMKVRLVHDATINPHILYITVPHQYTSSP